MLVLRVEVVVAPLPLQPLEDLPGRGGGASSAREIPEQSTEPVAALGTGLLRRPGAGLPRGVRPWMERHPGLPQLEDLRVHLGEVRRLPEGLPGLLHHSRIHPEDRLGDATGTQAQVHLLAHRLEQLVLPQDRGPQRRRPGDLEVARGRYPGERLPLLVDVGPQEPLLLGPDDDPGQHVGRPVPALQEVPKLGVGPEALFPQTRDGLDPGAVHQVEEPGILVAEPKDRLGHGLEGLQGIVRPDRGDLHAAAHLVGPVGGHRDAERRHPAALRFLAEDQVGGGTALPRTLGHLPKLEGGVGLPKDLPGRVQEEPPEVVGPCAGRTHAEVTVTPSGDLCGVGEGRGSEDRRSPRSHPSRIDTRQQNINLLLVDTRQLKSALRRPIHLRRLP